MLQSLRAIEIQSWMQDTSLRRLFDLLNAGSSEPQALLVGGCVRNALLGMHVDDIDVAAKLSPQEVTRRLEADGVKVVPTGIDHGTVTAVIEGRAYEITTLRADVETDGRRAVVAYTQCWLEDAQRRDFTMNTLLMDLGGSIYDPVEQGLADLEARYIRFVGEPAQRIAEDYLRVLRYFRFHALYGSDVYDEDALQACREASGQLCKLSKERVSQEFFKIIGAPQPGQVLQLMEGVGVLAGLGLSLQSLEILDFLARLQVSYEREDMSVRLYLVSGGDEVLWDGLCGALIIPKLYQKDWDGIVKVLALFDGSGVQNLRECMYRCGKQAAAQGILILTAQDELNQSELKAFMREIDAWDIPMFPLTGQDLMDEGYAPGPALGEELRAREEAWIARGFEG